jgi:hypothetical protein
MKICVLCAMKIYVLWGLDRSLKGLRNLCLMDVQKGVGAVQSCKKFHGGVQDVMPVQSWWDI